MHVLEENFLRSIVLLQYITNRIEKKFLGKKSIYDFQNRYPSYMELNMVFYHAAIMQARKLFEAGLDYGLEEEKWYKLKLYREEVTHAKNEKSKMLTKIGDLNNEIIPKFNKLSGSI
jgi:hypothetical protein